MPIIVDEVVISVEVGSQETGRAPAGQGSLPAEQRQALVNECVERVLDVLTRREEP